MNSNERINEIGACAVLEAAQEQLITSQEQLTSAQEQLNDVQQQLNDAQAQLTDAQLEFIRHNRNVGVALNSVNKAYTMLLTGGTGE